MKWNKINERNGEEVRCEWKWSRMKNVCVNCCPPSFCRNSWCPTLSPAHVYLYFPDSKNNHSPSPLSLQLPSEPTAHPPWPWPMKSTPISFNSSTHLTSLMLWSDKRMVSREMTILKYWKTFSEWHSAGSAFTPFLGPLDFHTVNNQDIHKHTNIFPPTSASIWIN